MNNVHSVPKHTRNLTLWTERGAARHAKMLDTDQAWEVFKKLEDSYFSKRPTLLPNMIDTAQQGELATLIAERFPDGKHRPYAWSRFNNHFRLSGYKTLPAEKFDEACASSEPCPSKARRSSPWSRH